MLQQPEAEDYVIATGEQHSVRDFVTLSAAEIGIEIDWQGQGEAEQGLVRKAPADSAVKPGQVIVAVDARYFRPAEVDTLMGDASKAKAKLGWAPKTTFAQLVTEMMAADLQSARRDAFVAQGGFGAPRAGS